MFQATVLKSLLGLKKGQTYTVDTDDTKAVFKTPKGKQVVFIPINQIGKIQLRAINDNAYN